MMNSKIREVNEGVTQALMTTFLLFLSISLVTVATFMMWNTTPENILIKTNISMFVGFIGTTLFLWWIFDAYEPRQWKKIFLEKFPEINASVLEQTLVKTRKIHDNDFPYRQVATALVSVNDSDENSFGKEVERIYNSYLEETK